MILTTNRHFPEHIKIYVFLIEIMCFLWGTNLISKYSSDKLPSAGWRRQGECVFFNSRSNPTVGGGVVKGILWIPFEFDLGKILCDGAEDISWLPGTVLTLWAQEVNSSLSFQRSVCSLLLNAGGYRHSLWITAFKDPPRFSWSCR